MMLMTMSRVENPNVFCLMDGIMFFILVTNLWFRTVLQRHYLSGRSEKAYFTLAVMAKVNYSLNV
jgi:hypothetical protein